ncbi:MAG: aminoglycoside phosphotransferase family protein [Woeseiaceae bacterium]
MDTVAGGADARLERLKLWLADLGGFDVDSLRPASADASFRRYFRVDHTVTTRIVMDAPPDREDCAPYIRIAGYLARCGLNAPRVLQADTGLGFLLLTDLGSRQYLQVLKDEPGTADRLYGDALLALLRLQSRGARFQGDLPPYDEQLLRFELSLFRDWLCGRHLGLRFTAADESRWQHCCTQLIDNAASQSRVFVHRDFHSRNLMQVDGADPGILDFQDAVEGPCTYDLVSLLKDCYIRWPIARIEAWAEDFRSGMPDRLRPSHDQFRRSFDLMGVQRQLKAAGIFTRLNHRDGKPRYMNDVPRTLEYILDIAARYPELAFLARLVRERCLPGLDRVPA